MRVAVTTPPNEVVSLEEARAHLRWPDHDDDDLIRAYVEAATQHLDGPAGWLGRALGDQVLTVTLDAFETDCRGGLVLPFGPFLSLVSVKYDDATGVERTIAPEDCLVVESDHRGPVLMRAGLAPWPSPRAYPGAVRISYRAGYVEIPAPIRSAILLLAGDLYKFRETAVVGTAAANIPMSAAVEALVSPYRVWRV